MHAHQVLFCPFCRDSFEGQTTCPACELPLVPFEKLGPAEHETTDADEPELAAGDPDERRLSLLDPQHGRLSVALGALVVGAALLLDLVRFPVGRPLRTHELARALPSLWSIGLVSFVVLYALARRRTPRALRGLRVIIPLLGLVPPFAVAFVLVRRFQGDVSLGAAAYAVGLGSLLLIAGGLRLGAR